MTRVLVVEAAGNLWGSERALLDLLEGLNARDVGVCLPSGTPLEAELRKRNVKTYPYLLRELHLRPRWRRAQAALGVLRACLEHRPGLLYLNQAGVFRVVKPAADLFRLGIVAHVRIFEDVSYLGSCAPSSGRLRGIVAISKAIADEVRGHRNLASFPLCTIYDAYASAPPTKQSYVRLKPGVIACVGRIVPIKGQDILVRALPRVREAYPDVSCLIIGDGDSDYIRRTKEHARGLGSVISWTGYRSDIVSLLRECAVLVCPSSREPLGRVIFEAWEAGAVPVAFRGSGGAGEVMAAAHGGVLYDAQEPASLADAIIAALSLADGERSRLIGNGRAWLAANCEPAAYGSALGRFFDACAR